MHLSFTTRTDKTLSNSEHGLSQLAGITEAIRCRGIPGGDNTGHSRDGHSTKAKNKNQKRRSRSRSVTSDTGSQQMHLEVGGRGVLESQHARSIPHGLNEPPTLAALGDELSEISEASYSRRSDINSAPGGRGYRDKIVISVTQWYKNVHPHHYVEGRHGQMTPVDSDGNECIADRGHGVCAGRHFTIKKSADYFDPDGFGLGSWRIIVKDGDRGGRRLKGKDCWFVDATLGQYCRFIVPGVWVLQKSYEFKHVGVEDSTSIEPFFSVQQMGSVRHTEHGTTQGDVIIISNKFFELIRSKCYNKTKDTIVRQTAHHLFWSELQQFYQINDERILKHTISYYNFVMDAWTLSSAGTSVLRVKPLDLVNSYTTDSDLGEVVKIIALEPDLTPIHMEQKNKRWLFLSKKYCKVFPAMARSGTGRPLAAVGYDNSRNSGPLKPVKNVTPLTIFSGEFRFETMESQEPSWYKTAFLQFNALSSSQYQDKEMFRDWDTCSKSMVHGATRYFNCRKDENGEPSLIHDNFLQNCQNKWLCVLWTLEKSEELEHFLEVGGVHLERAHSTDLSTTFKLTYLKRRNRQNYDMIVVTTADFTRYSKLVAFHTGWRMKAKYAQCCRLEFMDKAVNWLKKELWFEVRYFCHLAWVRAHAEEPHPKKQFRLKMLEDQLFDHPDLLQVQMCETKIKKETAKAGKAPRLYTNLDAGVMYAPELSDIQKKCYGSSAGALELRIHRVSAGENLVTFADDVGGAIENTYRRLLSDVFLLRSTIVQPIDVRLFVITSGEHSKLQEAFEALEWSLRTPNTMVFLIHSDDVTFVGNNRGCLWNVPTPSKFQEMVHQIGYNITCDDTCGILARVQFLKNTPYYAKDSSGHSRLTYARNYGAIFRNLGKVYGDMTAKQLGMSTSEFSTLTNEQRGEKFISGVVRGYVNEPSSSVLTALRNRFDTDCEDIIDEDSIPFYQRGGQNLGPDPRSDFTLDDNFFWQRYGIEDHQITEFVNQIDECKIGSVISNHFLSKIYAVDYGLGPSRQPDIITNGYGPFGFNLDISSCDSSNSMVVFAQNGLQQAGLDVEHASSFAAGLIAQCALPTTLRNPLKGNRTEQLVVQPLTVFEYSGSTLTTVLNNIASTSIAVTVCDSIEWRVGPGYERSSDHAMRLSSNLP